jgi:hypothetical protein
MSRSGRPFHHHASLGIAAGRFLVAERSRFLPPPEPVNWDNPGSQSRRISGRGVPPIRSAAYSMVDRDPFVHEDRPNPSATAYGLSLQWGAIL